jgi:hypothetical protein
MPGDRITADAEVHCRFNWTYSLIEHLIRQHSA